MPRCNYRLSGTGRARYIPSDCKYCNPDHCQEYLDYVKIQGHKQPGDLLEAAAHKWFKEHHLKKCQLCGADLQ